MYKFVAILFLIGALAKVQAQQLQKNSNNIDEYINENRNQYAKNIRDYDHRIAVLKQSYSASLQIILKRLELLVNSIDQTEQRFNSLQVLSGLIEKCIKQNRSKLPNVYNVKQQINQCYNTASNQEYSLLQAASITRANLNNYYKINFENDLEKCKIQSGDYNTCVINAISNANDYTDINRKTFDSQMKSSQTNANGYIEVAFQCTYTTQNQATSAIAETNVLTNKCLKDCKPCGNQNYSCSSVSFLQRSEVHYNEQIMKNVFYGRYDVKDCLMLKIYN